MAQKSFDLRVEDTRRDLVNVLNNSGLPISVLAMIVKEINETVANQNVEATQKARADYENQLMDEMSEPEQHIDAEMVR